MRLLHFDRWTLESTRAPAELTARLEALVEPERLLRLGGGERPFQGQVSAGRFRISRIPRSRNAFLPQLIGEIIATPTGSRLEVLLRLNLVTLGFLFSSLLFLAMIGSGVFLVRGLRDPGAWVPALLFVAAYAVSLRAFSSEAQRARALLEPVVR